MVTDYTVTIALLAGATITPGVDNITNVSLTVSSLVDGQPGPPNDANNLSLENGDRITWQPNTITGHDETVWTLTAVQIGKKLANKNPVRTSGVFDGAMDLENEGDPKVRPANAFDLRKISDPTMPTTIALPNNKVIGGKSEAGFAYRITFKNSDDESWWIDPEIDVSPPHD